MAGGIKLVIDAASSCVSVYQQVILANLDATAWKLAFETETSGVGVGILKSADLTTELVRKNKATQYSGVGASHQNGVQNAIKTVTCSAHTMMMQAMLRWLEVKEKKLLFLALHDVVHIFDHTMKTKLNYCDITNE